MWLDNNQLRPGGMGPGSVGPSSVGPGGVGPGEVRLGGVRLAEVPPGNDRLPRGGRPAPTTTVPDTDYHCPRCNGDMTLLGTLPAIRQRSAVTVLRCFVCNRVVSYER